MTNRYPKPQNGEAVFDQGMHTAASYKKEMRILLVICIVGFGFILPVIFTYGTKLRWGITDSLWFYFLPIVGGLLVFPIFAALGYMMVGKAWLVTDKAIYAVGGRRYEFSEIKKITRHAQAVTKTGQLIDFPNCRDKHELRQHMRNALETAQ